MGDSCLANGGDTFTDRSGLAIYVSQGDGESREIDGGQLRYGVVGVNS